MGFTTLFDIVGSMIIGGILMMMVWRLSDANTEKTYNNNGELTVQQNLLVLAEMIEFDFRKIGYCNNWNAVMDPRTKQPFNSSQAIIYADETSMTFYTDLYPYDGFLDSVSYYLGPVSECSSTPNPRDRILYRVENGNQPKASNLGVTGFRMVYFDVNDDSIPYPVLTRGLIKSIEINIQVENVAAYDEKYSNAFWKQLRLASRNVSRSKTE
ncbi:MAG: hypothetical protein OQJ93_10250 [Ignavibacteriaceae bacterium]|jgi:hypothetical protein|nr:hypothetical protein [Ignavibacteriaceae bacterium]MCW9097759.1 hypothetical protein [Ignavibacteriaceae bacterium]